MVVTLDELEEIAIKSDICYICGRELNWKPFRGRGPRSDSPSLDRVNNEVVMTKDNIDIACHRCNVTKSDRTLKEFIEYCKHITNKWGDE